MNITVEDIPTQILLTTLLFIDWSLWEIENLHQYPHQKETIYGKLISFTKSLKSKRREELELECLLLISIYSYSKFIFICKTRT